MLVCAILERTVSCRYETSHQGDTGSDVGVRANTIMMVHDPKTMETNVCVLLKPKLIRSLIFVRTVQGYPLLCVTY